MTKIQLGEAIPTITPHAISVSLPTWRDNIGYEEGEQRVWTKMATGYPRFFIHKCIKSFADAILNRYGHQDRQRALLFPSTRTAQGCIDFIVSRDSSISRDNLQSIDLVLETNTKYSETLMRISPSVSAVLMPIETFSLGKQYWQHTGDGISSRRADFCHHLFQEGMLVKKSALRGYSEEHHMTCKGPRRYQRESFGLQASKVLKSPVTDEYNPNRSSTSSGSEVHESSQFLEERFGRNLNVSQCDYAKSAIKRRIAGSLTGEKSSLTKNLEILPNVREIPGLTENDVYLWSCGMNSIFHTHKMLLKARGYLKSISFGFPYVDTLKILEKFGPGCLFYGNGSSEDLDDLEKRLRSGERYLALFCEFPGNPLLKSPDLLRIRELADAYDFAVVVDETIGNFINVNVLPYSDVVVSSLTKIFSGECNVMGGGSILNPKGPYYNKLKTISNKEYEDNYWAEDAIFLERNSRDYVKRIEKINENAEALCSLLKMQPLISDIYYPKYSPTTKNYDACRRPNGGYGGLLSFRFQNPQQAVAFYDSIELAKGPSLGTNFTLVSPYVVLAHFLEFKWAAEFGVHADLIRVSVGLEGRADLISSFEAALKIAGET